MKRIEYYLIIQKMFSRARKDNIVQMSGVSKQLVHNLMRCIYRPRSSSVPHWKGEILGFLVPCLTEDFGYNRRPKEYLFRVIATGYESPMQFSLSKELLREKEREYGIGETINYGCPREIKLGQVALGLWIFYRSIDETKVYTKEEVIDIIEDWFELISDDPGFWSCRSGVKFRDVRLTI